jgi:DNA (cytosine-5)-methyltransferase 1
VVIFIKHFGDITKIDGHKVPIVDVITGGSPCQDLSVAGKRAGLAGERSGLFMEQMRLVKEQRDESRKQLQSTGAVFSVRDIKPRYMVWENVVGAFSSGNPGGSDFKAVLEEIARVVVAEVPDIPIPEQGWPLAGCIEGMGDEGVPFSICWRTHDAQYWGKTVLDNSGKVVRPGTPQRRRRIALVADFGGKSAPEILFEPESMPGNFESSSTQGEGTSAPVGECSEESGET